MRAQYPPTGKLAHWASLLAALSGPGTHVLFSALAESHAVSECTELYLGNKGIEKLRGFEPFVNLDSLWLNGNKLKKINNLDGNFRIRTLYAQVTGAVGGVGGGHRMQRTPAGTCMCVHACMHACVRGGPST